MICSNINTGEQVWKEKVTGNCWGSLVLADGNIYITDKEGTCHIIKADTTYQKIAENRLDEITRSSLAISNGELFIRTYEHLWCIKN